MLVVVVALGLFIRFHESKPIRDNPLLEFDPKEVAQVGLKTTKSPDEITLVKKDDQWRMTKPLDTAAESSAVEALLNSTKEILQSGGDFPLKESKLKEYGLDKPKVVLTVQLKGGRTPRLELGEKTPGSLNVYAKRPGGKRIYLIAGSVFDAADKSTDDLRDKTAIHLDRDNVTGFTLAYEDKKFEIAKETDTQWTMKSPRKAAADAVSIDGYLNTVKGLKATRFITEKMDQAATYGLDKPQLRVEFVQKRKENVSLLIGAKSKEDPVAVYAKTSSDPQVYLLSDAVLNQLKKDLNEFRSKNVMTAESDKVSRLQVASANGDVEVERSGSGATATWKIQKPKDFPADKVKVDAIVNALTGMKATEFIDQPKPDAEYGFDKPQSKLTVWLEGGKSPYRTLLLGKKVKNPDARYVKIAGEPPVYKVNWSATDDDNLMPKVSALREKLISKFEKDKAEKITLKPFDGKAIVLERQGKDDWKITSPQKADANKVKVDNIVFATSDLRGDEWIEDDPKDLAKYGLDKPRLEVDISVKDGPTQSFVVGKKDPSNAKSYVLTRGKAKTLYLKAEFAFTDLFQDFAALKK